MASIFRKPRSPYYFAAYRDANGQRRQKTTKTTNRRKALEMAVQWEKLAENGRDGVLTESVARSVISELVRQSTGEPLHFATCRGWMDEWLTGKTGTTAEGTMKKYRQVITDFHEHLGSRADLPLTAISVRDVRSFRDALASGGRSATTVNQTIRKTLSVPFGAALRIGYIPMNPCSAVEALMEDQEFQREVFTEQQVAALVDAAEGEWKGVVLAGYFTGLRLRDITGLLWESVDMDENVLRLRTRKTRSDLLVPIHEQLVEWLTAQPRGTGKASVFPTLNNNGTGGRHGLSGRFAAIMQKAGISGKQLRIRKGAGRATTSLSFHSLRHSFVSALANAGVAPDLRQKLAGHADSQSHARYTHHEIENMRAAVAKISIGKRP